MLRANWDKLDANKDGFLDATELSGTTAMLNKRIADAQAQQSVGQ
jgi:hypothetical protein